MWTGRSSRYARSVTGGPNPDTLRGVVEFEGGAIGVVETIQLLPRAAGIIMLDEAFQVVGSRGVANLHLVPGALSFWREDGFEVPDVSYDPLVNDSARGALREGSAYLRQCVDTGQPPQLNTGTDGQRGVRVALALIESASRDKDVEINDLGFAFGEATYRRAAGPGVPAHPLLFLCNAGAVLIALKYSNILKNYTC